MIICSVRRLDHLARGMTPRPGSRMLVWLVWRDKLRGEWCGKRMVRTWGNVSQMAKESPWRHSRVKELARRQVRGHPCGGARGAVGRKLVRVSTVAGGRRPALSPVLAVLMSRGPLTVGVGRVPRRPGWRLLRDGGGAGGGALCSASRGPA